MAKLLELDDDYFINNSATRLTLRQVQLYPPCSRLDLVFSLKPHFNGTFASLLMVDNSVGGLQVLQDGVWYDVPTRPHTLLINLGDQIEVMNYH